MTNNSNPYAIQKCTVKECISKLLDNRGVKYSEVPYHILEKLTKEMAQLRIVRYENYKNGKRQGIPVL